MKEFPTNRSTPATQAGTAVRSAPPQHWRAVPAHTQRVIVVMPAYNTARTLAKTVAEIPPGTVDEIILVDNASRDQTVHAAQELGLRVVVHPENRGYGGNQKTCYTEALREGAEVVVMVHSDFQYDPQRIPDFVRPILDNEADAVIGSRFLGQSPRIGGMPWWKYVGNRFLTRLQNRTLGTHFSECHSGYRAYHRRVLEAIPFFTFQDGFVFDSEMIVALVAGKFRITEVPILTRYEADSSSLGFWGSLRYGLATLWTLRPALRQRLRGGRTVPPAHD